MEQYEKSYARHQRESDGLDKAQLIDILQKRLNETPENALLNAKRYSKIFPLLQERDKWLTVGDYLGEEAKLLSSFGVATTASDINTTYLEVAKQENFISDYSWQNAEKMTFEDGSFDYVFCRDSYHHFPRPYLAVYEMLRCASKGVVIDEPLDPVLKMPLLLFLCNLVDTKKQPLRSYSLWKNRFSFESAGNFVYKVSSREFEKMSMGIGLPAIAFYYSNSSNNMIYTKSLYNTLYVFLSKMKLIPKTTMTTLLFKKIPDETMKQKLLKAGWMYCELPKNPYL
jgi:ubiquinone/menaquinone biosynthesis C-methylase UbiE